MKKILITILLLSGCFGYAEVVTNFYADFTGLNTDSLDKDAIQSGTELGTWVFVTQEESSATNGAIRLDKGTYNYRAAMDQDEIVDLSTNVVRIRYDVRSCRGAQDVGGKAAIFRLFDENLNQMVSIIYSTLAAGTGAVEVETDSLSLLSTDLAGPVDASVTTPPDAYEHFEIVLSSSGLDIWVNGTQLADGIAYASTSTSASLRQFRLIGSNDNAGAWYDNIVVTTEPVPPVTIRLFVLTGGI